MTLSKCLLVLLLGCVAPGTIFPQDVGDAGGQEIHFVGPVFAIDRDSQDLPVAITVRVNASQVQVHLDDWTELTQGRGFQIGRDQLRLGDFVDVTGFFASSGRIFAQRIQITNGDLVDAEGPVEAIGGSSIRLHGIFFAIDANTFLHASGSSQTAKLSQLQTGTPVRVRANEQNGVLIARELEFGERTVESTPLRLQGIVVKVQGQLLSLDVGIPDVNALIALDTQTQIEDVLVPGRFVEVEGRFLPGTALVKAQRIAVDSNQNGNLHDESGEQSQDSSQIEIEGVVSNLETGNQGQVTRFFLNETRIELNAGTRLVYEGGAQAPFDALRAGVDVEVLGVRQGDGSVSADLITIEDEDDGSGEDAGEDDLEPIEIEGRISQVTREENRITRITVGTTIVHVSETTEISWESDEDSSIPRIETGWMVRVFGTREPDGSITASKIEIKD